MDGCIHHPDHVGLQRALHAGWHEFSDIHPNAAHASLARLQRQGWVDALITQNVDRLHQKAGATDVIELHGTTHRWACGTCSTCHRQSSDIVQKRSGMLCLRPRATSLLCSATAEKGFKECSENA